MNGISSVSNSSYSDYGDFASGKKVSSASEGAAELAIIQKEDAQIKGQQAGADNIGAAQDMLNISDAAMSDITDNLQRIRELAVGASNDALLTDADRGALQDEIEQLKKGISDIASDTNYNTKNLLDGSNLEFNIATDANGGEINIEAADATLAALGIADFDVTGSFNLNDIDHAIDLVSAGRGSMGAQGNALEHAYNYSVNTSLNTTAAKSRLEDLDFPKAISEQKKKETLQEYQLFMQKRRQEDEAVKTRSMFL